MLPCCGVVAAPAIVLVSKVCGLYERDELVLKKTTLDEAPRLLQMAALYTLLLWLVHDGFTAVELDASDVLIVWGATFALLVGLRGFSRWAVRSSVPPERCLVVGPANSIAVVRQKLRESRVNAEVVAAVPVDLHSVRRAAVRGARRTPRRAPRHHRPGLRPGRRRRST